MGHFIKGNPNRGKATKIKLVLSLTFGVLFLSLAIVISVIDPIILYIKYSARVDYGTYVHEALSKEVDSVHLSAYLFNVTNAERFASGEDEKLIVEEIGPFTYQENRTNEDLEIDLEAGVMRYSPRQHVTFLPEESVGNPEDMIVTLPNVAMLAMGSSVSNYGILAQVGFNMLASRLDSNATVTMSVYDYLWGYKEPLIELGNQFLPGWINFETLGVLDRLYDKKAVYRLEVSSSDEDKFMIKTVNGLGGLKEWGYEDPEQRTSCNSFNDTYEGLSYPSGVTPTWPIKIYRNVLCRFMDLEYVGMHTMDFGVEGLMYRISNRSFDRIPENECLCSKGTCTEGVSDLSPCFYGLPVVLSNAHFMDADPALYKRIEGMTPNFEDHGSEFMIDPIIGLVMATKFSVQLNVNVRDVTFNSKISKYSNMFVPVLQLKIVQPRLPDETISTLRVVHIYAPYILIACQISFTIAGLLLLLLSTRLLYWNWIVSRRKGVGLKTEIVEIKDVLSNEPFLGR